MKRIHFIELEDLPGCPRVLRDGATDYLRLMLRLIRGYSNAFPLLQESLARSGRTQIVDLCSGGTGPWPVLMPLLKRDSKNVSVLLTDKYPNVRAFEQLRHELGENAPEFERESIDARDVPQSLSGYRTIFTAFHHFKPADAKAILQDAVTAGEPIAVFEITERSLRGILATLTVPIFMLLLTPFMRPFCWSRLFWTYIIPALPIVTAFDGVVSALRSYSPEELLTMTRELNGRAYDWESGSTPGFGPPVTYLIGSPRSTQ